MIIGAGLTGLAAGIKTKMPIYEASDHTGSICRSYTKNGFTFSQGGGHWCFGNVDYIKTQVPLNTYERKAGIYYNTIFPYPIQTVAQQVVCFNKDDTMKMWFYEHFGQELCNLFFNPFHDKYMAGLYDKVIQTDSFKAPKAGGTGFCPTFHDPIDGINSLIDKMASKCTIEYNKHATGIDGHRVIFSDGSAVKFDKLISTIPLNDLLTLCHKPSDLPYTSVLCLNIGAEPGVNTPTEHWLYIPFSKNNFYRIGFYSNADPKYAPEGKVSLWVEMAFLPHQKPDIEQIVNDIEEELISWGWIKGLITSDPTWVDCAYTWNYNKEDRENAIQWLKERDIYSIGRYGSWRFQGMTESIQEGLNVDISGGR